MKEWIAEFSYIGDDSCEDYTVFENLLLGF